MTLWIKLHMNDFFNHHAISWRKIPLDWFGGKLFSLRFYTTYNSNENDNGQWKNRTTPPCFPLKNEIVPDTIAHEILTTWLTSLQVSNQKCCCRWHFLPYHHFHALSLSLSLSYKKLSKSLWTLLRGICGKPNGKKSPMMRATRNWLWIVKKTIRPKRQE